MAVVLFSGGLGNQLFQYTFMLYLKEIEKKEVGYNLSSIPFFHIHSGFEADKVFDLKDFREDKKNYFNLFYRSARKINKILFNRPLFCNDKVFAKNKDAQVYEGFWMDKKYYSMVKQFLIARMRPMENYCNDISIKQKIRNSNSVFIHVRRGDYVNNSSYYDLSQTAYYRNAIEYVRNKLENPEYFVFSDDIEWCKQYFTDYPDLNFVHYKGQSTLGDLGLMLMCKNAIIANSSFSWWGAALDTKQVVVRPSKYFNDGQNKTMHPEEWIPMA